MALNVQRKRVSVSSPSSGFEEIPHTLAPGIQSLADSVKNIKVTLHGTPEEPELGLVSRTKRIEDLSNKVISRLNIWGGVLLGAFIASGLLSGEAAKTVHNLLGAFVK
jgi:hypothetical protein